MARVRRVTPSVEGICGFTGLCPMSAADLPKVLRFVAKNGEDRAAALARFKANEGNFDGATGHVEVHKDGVPSGRFPFVQALFGRNATCEFAKVVVANPPDACTALVNEKEVVGAIVLVQRGDCAFASKAMNVQTAEGIGMVLMNDRVGAVFRMPQNTGDLEGPVEIAAVMVTELDGVALQRVLKGHHHAPVVARLASEAARCDEVGSKARKLQPVDAGKVNDSHTLPVQEEDPSQPLGGVRMDEGDQGQLLHALESLLDPSAWPANEVARRKLYGRLAKVHHPDAATGSKRAFAMLSQAFETANEVYATEEAGGDVAAEVTARLAGHRSEL